MIEAASPAVALCPIDGGRPVKKLLVLLLAAGIGFAVWRKIQADKFEQDLWTEATNEVADLR
jgi:hypothetical protein